MALQHQVDELGLQLRLQEQQLQQIDHIDHPVGISFYQAIDVNFFVQVQVRFLSAVLVASNIVDLF